MSWPDVKLMQACHWPYIPLYFRQFALNALYFQQLQQIYGFSFYIDKSSKKLLKTHGLVYPQFQGLYCDRHEFFFSLTSECTLDRFTCKRVFFGKTFSFPI